MIQDQCDNCKYLELGAMVKIGGEITGTCKAFPSGIPLEIYDDEISHDQPYIGDNGVVYKEYTGDFRL